MKETTLQCHVADYLRLRYPNILFHSDYGSGIKLTPGQSRIQYRQNGGRRGWPDMFIAEPRTIRRGQDKYSYAGLFIELKREGTRIYKKDGVSYATSHLADQAEVLVALNRAGYLAMFAVGFDQAKQIIDEYLGGPIESDVEF